MMDMLYNGRQHVGMMGMGSEQANIDKELEGMEQVGMDKEKDMNREQVGMDKEQVDKDKEQVGKD